MAKYLNCPGTTGSYCSTPDNAAFPSGTGAIVDIIAEVLPNSWTVAARANIAAHSANVNGLRSWEVGQFGSSGTALSATISQNGTNTVTENSGSSGLTGQSFVRWVIDTNGLTVKCYKKTSIGDCIICATKRGNR